MKISYNWLKEYVQFDQSPQEVAEILTLTGLEVDDIQQVGSDLNGVIVGEVLSADQHPNADRLKVCKVNSGTEILQIVCGAPNVEAGQKVPLAVVGTELPLKLPDGSNLVIKKSKIRGEVSEGMLCAEDELGLGESHEGLLILDSDTVPGTPISQVLSLNTDYIFEIGLTPNRPDASCHLGVARDLAAVINKPLKRPYKNFTESNAGELSEQIKVEIKNPEKCHRYVGLLIRNVKIGPSPAWLKDRISSIGLRSINNVVDATNFVLHELGQPLHAFDYDLIAGKKIVVQSFDHEVKFTTLDEQERTIAPGSLFICDGEKPVALAGIMGGMNSEIHLNTTNVFLESAYFEPVGIRKASKQTGLQTDSSYRFERGIDPHITLAAAYRCAKIIADVAGGKIFDGHIDVHPVISKHRVISLRLSRLNKIIGMEFRINQAISILRSLEFEVRKNGEDTLYCTVPSFRPDVTEEIDLIEEVARIYDYNKIPNPEYIQFSRPEPISFRENFQEKVKNLVVSAGFREIYANSLLPETIASKFAPSEEMIFTLNPISRDTAVLRPSLVPGFIRAAAFNFNRDADTVKFFEVGNVFRKVEKGTYHKNIKEETNLLIGLGGLKTQKTWNQSAVPFSIFDVKGAVDALLASLRLAGSVTVQKESDVTLSYFAGKQKIGELRTIPGNQKVLFDTNEPLYYAEFSLTQLQKLAESLPLQVYKPVPKFPGIEFDLALSVSAEVDSAQLEAVIRQLGGSQLRSSHVFDVYEGKNIGEGQKSIGYRLKFSDETKTLTIKDVDGIINRMLKRLEKDFGATLRA